MKCEDCENQFIPTDPNQIICKECVDMTLAQGDDEDETYNLGNYGHDEYEYDDELWALNEEPSEDETDDYDDETFELQDYYNDDTDYSNPER